MTNQKQVISTLKLLVNLLDKHHICYRFLGSIVTCALDNSVYRNINDLDLLVDENKVKILAEELVKKGFTKKIKNHLRISEQINLHIYQHPDLLEISFFGIKFHNDGSGELRTDNFRARIFPEAIIPTVYKLSDISFVGVPAEIVYKTILPSLSNPKRKREVEIFNDHNIKPFKKEIYKLYYKGIDITFLATLPNVILDIIGRLRKELGLNYDLWK